MLTILSITTLNIAKKKINPNPCTGGQRLDSTPAPTKINKGAKEEQVSKWEITKREVD